MNPQSNAKVRDALAMIFGGIEKLQAAFGNQRAFTIDGRLRAKTLRKHGWS